MLRHSIKSFRRWFDNDNSFMVYTDSASVVHDEIGNLAEVLQYPNDSRCCFNIRSKATWMKWCPSARLDISTDEFYVDSDVFLVQEPLEIYSFLQNDELKYAVLDEFKGETWQHGAMSKRAVATTPFINAGLFIQKKNHSIAQSLTAEYAWWQQNISPSDRTHHDEQGALAIALTKPFENGELLILPKDKYMLISEEQNTYKNDLEGVVLFHSTYPTHPAYQKFLPYLTRLLDD